ncbi:MAG: hypothetical protein N2050_04825 [Flavobacteriales bacterium]|nr:hypothetical protein [Flavobacteriales bacterium]
MIDPNLHHRVAEKGKCLAVEGRHTEALRYYKEALRLAQKQPHADIFFQHYSQCAMESLEMMGAHEEVIAFCEKCIAFLEHKEDSANQEYRKRYLASLWERMAIQMLFLQRYAEAANAFKTALQTAVGAPMPLSSELLAWCQKRYTINKNLIRKSQQRNGYFTVRNDNLKPELAIELPEEYNPY